jgi:WD40 repeat protein
VILRSVQDEEVVMNRFILGFIVTLGLSEHGSGVGRAEERTLPTGDGYSVRAIAFSPDGKLFLTGHGADEPSLFAHGHIKVWDGKSGKQLARLKARYGPVETLAFAPDGKTFAAGGATLKIWDVESRKPLRELPQKHRTLALAYAPDGKALATCHASDNVAHIWDPATGKSLAELRGHKGTVVSVSFSADAKTLATSSYDDERVILWDTATWKMSTALPVGVGRNVVRCSPKDSLLVVSGDPNKAPALWDIEKGKTTLALRSSRPIVGAAFSPDGKYLAAVDTGSSLTTWDVKTGERLAVIKGEADRYESRAVAFSPDGKLLATGDRKDDHATMVRIFEVGDLLKKRGK